MFIVGAEHRGQLRVAGESPGKLRQRRRVDDDVAVDEYQHVAGRDGCATISRCRRAAWTFDADYDRAVERRFGGRIVRGTVGDDDGFAKQRSWWKVLCRD